MSVLKKTKEKLQHIQQLFAIQLDINEDKSVKVAFIQKVPMRSSKVTSSNR